MLNSKVLTFWKGLYCNGYRNLIYAWVIYAYNSSLSHQITYKELGKASYIIKYFLTSFWISLSILNVSWAKQILSIPIQWRYIWCQFKLNQNICLKFTKINSIKLQCFLLIKKEPFYVIFMFYFAACLKNVFSIRSLIRETEEQAEKFFPIST